MKFLLAILLLSTFAFAQDDYSSGAEVSPQGDLDNEAVFVNGASEPQDEGRSIASADEVQEEPAQQGEFFTGATNP